MSELQAHHSMTPEQWTWLLCSVSFIPAKKFSLQEFSESIGIKLLTSGFQNIFASQFPGGRKCPFPGRPWLVWYLVKNGRANKCARSELWCQESAVQLNEDENNGASSWSFSEWWQC